MAFLITRARAGAGTRFLSPLNPASLFTSGEQGAWYDFSDSAKVFNDSGGVTPAGDLDPLGRINPSAGTLGAAVQSISTRRFEYHAAGFIRHDQVDDALQIPVSMTGQWSVAIAYVPTSVDWIMVTNGDNNNPWLGAGVAGSSNTVLAPTNVTQQAIYFDNELSSATTRGEQYDLSQAAKSVVVNVTITQALPAQIGNYNNGNDILPIGDIYQIVLRDRHFAADERALIETVFKSKTP